MENHIIEIEDKAYKAFDHLYNLQNPEPKAPSLKRDHAELAHDWIVGIAIFLIMLASVIVSAAHTIPLFVGSIDSDNKGLTYLIGGATLVMAELSLIIIAYYKIWLAPNKTKDEHIQNRLTLSVALIIAILMGGNLYSSFENFFFADKAIESTQPVSATVSVAFTEPATTETNSAEKVFSIAKFIIAALVGITAPIQVYITGDVLAILLVKGQNKAQAKFNAYKQDLDRWQTKRKDQWDISKAQYLAKVKKELPVNRSLMSVNPSVITNERTNYEYNEQITATNAGVKRNSRAKQIALDFFAQFPEKRDLSLNTLEVAISEWSGEQVKRTSIHEARKMLQ